MSEKVLAENPPLDAHRKGIRGDPSIGLRTLNSVALK